MLDILQVILYNIITRTKKGNTKMEEYIERIERLEAFSTWLGETAKMLKEENAKNLIVIK